MTKRPRPLLAKKFSKYLGVIPIKPAKSINGAIPMTLDELVAASDAVEQAFKFGNYAPLAKRLRSSSVLLSLERNAAADIVAGGGFKKPKHRMAQDPQRLRSKRLLLAMSVLAELAAEVEKNKDKVRDLKTADRYLKAAVAKVVEKESASRSAVYAAVEENRKIFAGYLSK